MADQITLPLAERIAALRDVGPMTSHEMATYLGISRDRSAALLNELRTDIPRMLLHSKCPWCGLTGVGFEDSPMPSDYCGHDPALMAPPPRRNGCWNRADLGSPVLVQHGWWSDWRRIMGPMPFAMTTDCQYTMSAAGRVDAGCHGCRHRKASKEASTDDLAVVTLTTQPPSDG